MNNPQHHPIAVTATQKIILASAFLTLLALIAGLLIASILFPSSAGSNQVARSASQPETPLEKKRIKLASSGAFFSIPGKVAEKAPTSESAETLNGTSKRAETIVPRQKNTSLNPYVKVDHRAIGSSSGPDASALPENPATREQQELVALTDSLVTVLERLKQQEQNSESGNLAATTDDLRQAIKKLVKQATSKGKSGDYVQSLIDDALAGRDAVPQALAKLDGKLDTRFLLAAILPKKTATNVGGSNSGYMAALQLESEYLANPASVKTSKAQKSRKAKKPRKAKRRYIVVRRGDNLSKISKRAYGDPLQYAKIYKANKALLTNAQTIDVGQRLLIP